MADPATTMGLGKQTAELNSKRTDQVEGRSFRSEFATLMRFLFSSSCPASVLVYTLGGDCLHHSLNFPIHRIFKSELSMPDPNQNTKDSYLTSHPRLSF